MSEHVYFLPFDGDILADISQERGEQIDKWGEQHHPDGTGRPGDRDTADEARAHTDLKAKYGTDSWRDILTEEVCEAYAETDRDALRMELTQVAAVAVAWIHDIDQREESANGGSTERAEGEVGAGFRAA